MSVPRDAEDVSTDLANWVSSCLKDIKPTLVSASKQDIGDGAEIRLVRANPSPEPRARDRVNLTVSLDYLITLKSPEPLVEHRLLVELAMAAMESADFQIIDQAMALELCRSMGLPSCACLLVRAELRRSRALEQAPLVRSPAVTRLMDLNSVEGTVVGPGDVPVAGAVVSLNLSDRRVVTGPTGKFRFPIPSGVAARATVKARQATVTADLKAGSPTLIKLPLEV